MAVPTIVARAARLNIIIEQGATRDLDLELFEEDETTIIPLLGFGARMQIRPTLTSDVVLFELTTENGRIEILGASGIIRLLFSAIQTEAFDWDSAVYDLELTQGTTVERFLKGTVKVDKEVTR